MYVDVDYSTIIKISDKTGVLLELNVIEEEFAEVSEV